jgi:hypothetical protein
MFTSKSTVVCQARAGHVPSTEHHCIFYIQETELHPQSLILFSTQFIHVSHSKGGRVDPSSWAYFLMMKQSHLELVVHALQDMCCLLLKSTREKNKIGVAVWNNMVEMPVTILKSIVCQKLNWCIICLKLRL